MDINTFFLLSGGILALMATFGLFMKQAGMVRKKNSTTAFSLFPLSWLFAVLGYFLVGFTISYGYHFFVFGEALNADQGYQALRFFFLSSVACLIPAIISGSLAERATLKGQVIASTILVALIYPLLEGTVWGNLVWLNGRTGLLKDWLGLSAFHDFGGSVIINLLAGFAALGGLLVLGPRAERYLKGKVQEFPPSSPLLTASGNWLTALTLIGIVFARFSGDMSKATALAPLNVLLGIVGGALSQFVLLKEEWHIRQGAVLAGAIAVLAGCDVYHPIVSLVVGFTGGSNLSFCQPLGGPQAAPGRFLRLLAPSRTGGSLGRDSRRNRRLLFPGRTGRGKYPLPDHRHIDRHDPGTRPGLAHLLPDKHRFWASH